MSTAEANGTQATEPQAPQATEGELAQNSKSQTAQTGKAQSARPRGDGARVTGPAIERHYQFILWLVPALDRFPRAQRFLLGDRIQRAALDVLESLIEATYTRRRQAALARANLGIEKLRFLMRLAHDLRYLDRRRYEFAARSLDETGRKIGAWIKAHRANKVARPV